MAKPTHASDQTQPTGLGIEPMSLLVSLTTIPVVLGLVGSKALTNAIQELGQLSEEVFRGDRLPVLKFPSTGSSSKTSVDID